MSILRHGGDVRGPALRLLTLRDTPGRPSSREHPAGPPAPSPSTAASAAPPPCGAASQPGGRPATSAVRAVASVLTLGAAIFYLAVAVKGVGGLLLGPPPEMVTTAGDLGASTRSAQLPPAELAGARSGTAEAETATDAAPGPGDQDLEVLLRPLAITGAALAGLLLLWSGVRGLHAVRDQRRWRGRQISGLIGFGLGTLAFGLGLAAADGRTAAYVGSVWQGVEPIRPSVVLALLIGSLALLLPARRRDPGPRQPARASTVPDCAAAHPAPVRSPIGR
ncbi:hypothetical protein [Actinomadura rugatobispora]|uniref:Integral membrane protein n=1 Tax=Actinomadura rugatobispora TaxID=1994 RepID=A0ABW0ZP75_9ACTN|nr:hypothetical protein GCM10010200_059060 [Actinomadura rugatobispora]